MSLNDKVVKYGNHERVGEYLGKESDVASFFELGQELDVLEEKLVIEGRLDEARENVLFDHPKDFLCSGVKEIFGEA